MAVPMRMFASENYAGVLPEIMAMLNREALKKSNTHFYNYDDVAHEVRRLIKETFTSSPNNPSPGIYFVFNGTAANTLSILVCTQPYDAVICSDISRMTIDESLSTEIRTDIQLISIPTDENGKINMDMIEENFYRFSDMHTAQVKMLTISQPTEYGTVYTINELKQLSNIAKKYDLYFRKSFFVSFLDFLE